MGVITDLNTRVDALVAGTSSIRTAVYDRLDAINEDSTNNYPLLLWRVTDSSDDNIRNTKHYQTLTVDFYLSDIHYQGDSETIPEKKDGLDEMLLELVTSIPDYSEENRQNNFELLNSSSAEYAWDSHNDEVVIVKRTVSIRSFKCIERI